MFGTKEIGFSKDEKLKDVGDMFYVGGAEYKITKIKERKFSEGIRFYYYGKVKAIKEY